MTSFHFTSRRVVPVFGHTRLRSLFIREAAVL